jgi:hypothetical protein
MTTRLEAAQQRAYKNLVAAVNLHNQTKAPVSQIPVPTWHEAIANDFQVEAVASPSFSSQYAPDGTPRRTEINLGSEMAVLYWGAAAVALIWLPFINAVVAVVGLTTAIVALRNNKTARPKSIHFGLALAAVALVADITLLATALSR